MPSNEVRGWFEEMYRQLRHMGSEFGLEELDEAARLVEAGWKKLDPPQVILMSVPTGPDQIKRMSQLVGHVLEAGLAEGTSSTPALEVVREHDEHDEHDE